MTFVALMVAALAVAQQGQRITESLNFDWRFHAGDLDNGNNNDLDDTLWRTVDLPHDFQIEQPWVAPAADERPDSTDVAANIRSRLSSRGFKEMGVGWYRYHFVPSDSLRNRRLLLDFGGIMYVGEVYLNGWCIGVTDYGYVGFQIDITSRVKWGQDNVLAVRADTQQPENSRWYTGGGLFRGVSLIATANDLYMERHPLYITTKENRYVTVGVEFTNKGKQKGVRLALDIYAPDGKLVSHTEELHQRKTASRTSEVRLAPVEIPQPQIWDTEHPNLYRAEVTLMREDGSIADRYSEHFGLRTIEITPERGLLLNGRKVLLKGYANHHSLGALGAAAYPRAIEKRIKLMKQFGMNHIRTSHNPYSREFIELCDRYGILVVDELYDKWTRQHTGGRADFEQLWQRDVPEWIKRDRNSPSVVMWSLGNELQQDPNQPFNDFGVTMYRLQRTLIQRYDSTRLVTVAMHPRYRNWETDSLPADLAMLTDVQSYNYRYMYFPGDGRRFPWMKFYQSEATVAGMGSNYFEMDLDRVIGLAYWGAIDYLGESQGWPAKGWSQGVFDIALEPKPKAWLMKSFFLPDEPTVHIGIVDRKGDMMWNGVQTGSDGMSDHWCRVAGQRLSLYTYTNADEVELLLNGHSLGKKANPKDDPKHRNQIRWNNIEYQPGTLEAVARTDGKIVARHKIETTTEPVRLVAEPDLPYNSQFSSPNGHRSTVRSATWGRLLPQERKNGQWLADGQDLLHVRITAVDKKGRRAHTADGEVNFELLEGDATIVGVINGDINSDELTVGTSPTTASRRLYNGTCTVILRAGRTPGKVTLRVTSPGLKPVSVQQQL